MKKLHNVERETYLSLFGAMALLLIFSNSAFAQIPQGFGTDNGGGKIGVNPASVAVLDRHNFSYSAASYQGKDTEVLLFTNNSQGKTDGIYDYTVKWAKEATTYSELTYIKGFSYFSIGVGQSSRENKFSGGTNPIVSSGENIHSSQNIYLALPLTYILLGVKRSQIKNDYTFSGWDGGSTITFHSMNYDQVEYGALIPGLLISGLDISYISRPEVKGEFTDSLGGSFTSYATADGGIDFVIPAYSSTGIAYSFGMENFGMTVGTEQGKFADVNTGTDTASTLSNMNSLKGNMAKLQIGEFINITVSQQTQVFAGYEYGRKVTALKLPFSNAYAAEINSVELTLKDDSGHMISKVPFVSFSVSARFGDASPNTEARCSVPAKTQSLSFYDKSRLAACSN